MNLFSEFFPPISKPLNKSQSNDFICNSDFKQIPLLLIQVMVVIIFVFLELVYYSIPIERE